MQATAASTTSRRLLAKLRDVMAGGGTAQERLDKVVKLIAADMVAEVCSCYVMRAGEVLELFATEGLKKSAVHHTRLRTGEGLVGDIAAHARPLALADAQSHANFAYRPETGEEIFHSLVGVPILRSGRVIGVLVVQNRSKRHYTDEEIETLETVAMVLAELVAGGELIRREELAPVDGNALLPLRLDGVRLNGGIGIGVAVLHQPRIHIKQLVAEDPDVEVARVRTAVQHLHHRLDELFSASDLSDSGEHHDIFETYRMFAEDSGWMSRIIEAIRSGLTAEAAVQKVHEDTRVRMSQVSDPYIRERLHDLEDLANRLLQHLSGESGGTAATTQLPDDAILVCRSMGPTELLDYDRRRLRGLALEEGSATLHVSIVARALDIPVVGRVKDLLNKIEPFDPIIVDGDNAQVFLRPSDDIVEAFGDNIKVRQQRLAHYAALRDIPATTRDGTEIELMLNAGLLIDLQHLDAMGAAGIGLYRTEIPFMARPELPDVTAQTGLYRKILEQAAGKPVVFRTLDVGGDKVLPYWNSSDEDNPALGWRSIRITLDCPAMLRQQLRALVQAAAGRELRVMFPMIAEVAEFDRAKALLDRELQREAERGTPPPRKLQIGTMLEVPALVWQLDQLLERVDFISIGSNDLTQFLFASDRGNPRVSERYDPLSPAMLNLIADVARRCREKGVHVSVCGEMAGKPLDAMALIGLGITTLSMNASSIGPVKTMICSLQLAPLSGYLDTLRRGPDHTLREKLRNFAQDHGVIL